jgi:ribosomal-protein-alanine N-acetyltransferase
MPEIETGRLRLRPFAPDDADVYYQRIFGDPDVTKYLRGRRSITRADMPALLTRLIDQWTQQGFGFWAVTDKSDGQLIGHCGLKYLDATTEIEIAYALAKSHWGRGFATEAARAVLRFGFEELKLDRIVAVAVPENAASRRVLEKIGLAFEKIDRYYDADLAYYTISRAQFQPGDATYRLL